MKKYLKVFTALALVVFVFSISLMPAFAADALTLNGVEGVNKGDIVSYTLYLGDCTEEIAGFQMYIHYDNKYLKVVEDSLNFNELDGQVIYNANSDGGEGIIFNFSNVSDLADFSKEKLFATVDFEVIKNGETEISFFVSELYGLDMTYLKSYTFTYDLAVNGELKIEGQPPVITTDKTFIDSNQGQFINYVDGKGEENGNGNGDGEAQRETIKGVTQPPSATTITDVTKGESDITTIIVAIVIVLIVLAIAILVILRKVSKRGSEEENEKQVLVGDDSKEDTTDN